MKVVNLYKLEALMPLLEDEEYNIKIIHLVRDPRAVTLSRTKAFKFNSSDVHRLVGMIM